MARDGEEARGGRPPELEDWLNRAVYHPLARRMALALRPTGISANAVSALSGLAIFAAALLYAGVSWPVSVALGFLAHALWHVLDGVDGELARLNGTASPLGELVDGVADYAGHVALYTVMAIVLDDTLGLWGWLIPLAAGISRVVQANHAESGRRTYLWRTYGIPWLKQARADDEVFRGSGLFERLFGPFARGYVKLAGAGNPLGRRLDSAMAERPSPRTRDLCRKLSRGPLRLQTLLGPNLRTVALALSMAAGSPLWFFLLEIGPLNLLLLVSIRRQRRCDRELAAAIGA